MVLVSVRHLAYQRNIRSSVSPPQASITNRQTIIVSVLNNPRTVGSSRRPMTRIRQGRRKPLDNWSGIVSLNRSDATAAKSALMK